jgi:hypothetical protein
MSIFNQLKSFFTGQTQDAMAQRRRHPRINSNTDVLMRGDRASVRGVLRDFSARGMRVAMGQRVAPGAEVAVLAANGDDSTVVKMRVVWCRTVGINFEVGLALAETAPHADNLLGRLLRSSAAVENPQDRRRAPRIKTNLQAGLQVSASMSTGRVVDLSTGGACVNGQLSVETGESITLFLPPYKELQGVALNGRVLGVTHGEENVQVHVQFSSLDGESGKRLNTLLRALMPSA